MQESQAPEPNRIDRHWRRVRTITGLLLTVWFGVTFGLMFFARELAGTEVFGWPFPFFVAAQGAMLIYLAIVMLYAWRMRRLDRQYHQQQGHEE
jgi:putative solute:sodium symporter small subunit